MSGGEGVWPPGCKPTPVSIFESGFSEDERRRLDEYMKRAGPAENPLFDQLAERRGPVITRVRQQLMRDKDWYKSRVYNDWFNLCRIDNSLISIGYTSGHQVHAVILHRCIRERNFDERELAIVDLFHRWLIQAIAQRRLRSEFEPNPEQSLPQRLREVLEGLKGPGSEKEIAKGLHLSKDTVHGYVTSLYRRFGVNSRAELMDCLQRGAHRKQ
ncbi:MAG TPA: LuxR C-terminal-related transcriptional regulator [Gemmataceae bacterium]|nr:LuxR C-terminal-related transcriptional regulator [Gemmataceae bacterium]